METTQCVLKNQQKINKTVERIIEYFATECTLQNHYETLTTVLLEFLKIYETLCKNNLFSDLREIQQYDIILLFMDVKEFMDMLEPFNEIAMKEREDEDEDDI